MLQPAWQEGSETEGNGANRASTQRVGVENYTALPSFAFIGKLLRDLQLLIPSLLRVNCPVTQDPLKFQLKFLENNLCQKIPCSNNLESSEKKIYM
jgi:hypothetical protein